MTDSTRPLKLGDATERFSKGLRRETDTTSAAGSPDEVDFRDDRTVTPTKPFPIIESLGDPSSIVGEALRLLGAKVQDLGKRRRMGCLALTSALPGEGKSTIALGLASALARDRGRRVLLVEADFRRPSITPTLGLPRAPGLSEWLNGEINYVPLRVVEPGGFFLLVSGEAKLERPEVLGSRRMDSLLRKARESFGFVLLDLAPVLPVADTVLVEQLIDGYLMVVRSRQTPLAAVRDALAKIEPEKVIGLVLNDHHEYRDSYRAYAYQRYGMGHGSGSSPEAGGGRSRGRKLRR